MSEESNNPQTSVTPFPQVPSPGETSSLILPIGSFDIAQNVYKSVRYSAFIGKARKNVAKPQILSNPGKLITAVLAEIIEFPDIKYDDIAEKKLLCRHMYSADRTACVLAIRKVTRQTPIVQTLDCPMCEANLQVTTTPDELQFVSLEETEFKLDESRKEYIYKYVSSRNDIVEFKLPRGIVEEGLTNAELKNIGEASQKILASCIETFNGEKIYEDFFDNESTGYIDELTDAFSDEQPGYDMNLVATCDSCGTTIDYRVDAADFLLPSARRKRFSKHGRKSAH